MQRAAGLNSFLTNSLQGNSEGSVVTVCHRSGEGFLKSPWADWPWQSLVKFLFLGIHHLRHSRSHCRSREREMKGWKDHWGKALWTILESLQMCNFRHKHVRKSSCWLRPRRLERRGTFVHLSQHAFLESLMLSLKWDMAFHLPGNCWR